MQTNRNHVFLLGSILLVALLIVTLGIAAAQEDDQPVFRIGILDDERGPITQGAALAVRQINQAGGVTGADGTRFRLELVIETTATGNNLADAIDRIAAASVIAVIGPESTEAVLSNLPQLQGLGIPVLTPAIGDTIIATDTSGLLFRTRAAERLLGRALAAYLVEDINASAVTTVQLDANSTAGRVGFSISLGEQSPAPTETTVLLEGEMFDLIQQVAVDSPATVVTFGAPELAAEFYNGLLEAGWQGNFAYPDANTDLFQSLVPLDDLLGVIGTTTWPVTAVDDSSTRFVTDFVRAYGSAPGEIEASAYDTINLIDAAIGEAGTLRENLSALTNRPGVQGILKRQGLATNEMSDAVAVVQVNAFGGPEPIARFASIARLPEDVPAQVGGTPQPTPTPAPEGDVITVESARQNIRTGPGTEYDVIGQLQQGDQREIIGANLDFTWVVIEYRGQNGWLFVPIADIFAERDQVPIVQAPPTPTPPPATATPTPQPFPDIIVVAANPNNITAGQLTNINVTIRNQGAAPAGPFAIAATFAPDNAFSAVNLGGLAAGQEQVVALPVTLGAATGNFNVTVVADLNTQVDEGPAGEANNSNFTFNYKVDRPLALINSITLPINGQLDLEGNVTPAFDVQFTAAGLNTTAACAGTANCIGVLSPGLTWDTVHFDAISGATGINQSGLPQSVLTPGATIGVLTAEGNRGVIRVDAVVPGSSITLTYRLYN